MTSLLPAYLKNHYKNEPIFQNARFIYSVYPDDEGVAPSVASAFSTKSLSNQLTEDSIVSYKYGELVDLHRGAAHFSDAVIISKGDFDWTTNIPFLGPKDDLKDGDWSQYINFFNNLMLQAEQSV
jgi:starch synthase